MPCTALAVRRIVTELAGRLAGCRAVVVGRSHNVGLPIQLVLGADSRNGGLDLTPTLTHRHTPGPVLTAALQQADLVVTAVGLPGSLTGAQLRHGCCVVDVGLNRVGGRVVGDCHPSVREVAGVVTPVPGGVGPCTVACLMQNTLTAACLQAGIPLPPAS